MPSFCLQIYKEFLIYANICAYIWIIQYKPLPLFATEAQTLSYSPLKNFKNTAKNLQISKEVLIFASESKIIGL